MDSVLAQMDELGLRLCGRFSPVPEDRLPALPGTDAVEVWMVGVAGSRFWPGFAGSAEYLDGLPDALDRWSRRIGQNLAAQGGGVALFPFEGPPHWPFQRWAMRCEPVEPSLLGLLMHPEFGLWHAFRFALLLPSQPGAVAQNLTQPDGRAGLAEVCVSCPGQPCLQACPVSAFAPGHYDVSACAGHLRTDASQDCMARGCLARRACPQGASWRYEETHAAFHMQAFRDAH